MQATGHLHGALRHWGRRSRPEPFLQHKHNHLVAHDYSHNDSSFTKTRDSCPILEIMLTKHTITNLHNTFVISDLHLYIHAGIKLARLSLHFVNGDLFHSSIPDHS